MFFFFDKKDKNADKFLTLEKLIENWENAASVWASQTSDKSKTLIATFGNPYIYAKYYRHIETYVNAYDPHPDVFKAFVKAIFGEIEFQGTTPVELKPYYKKISFIRKVSRGIQYQRRLQYWVFRLYFKGVYNNG